MATGAGGFKGADGGAGSGGGSACPDALVAVKEAHSAATALGACTWWQLEDAEALSALVDLDAAQRMIDAARLTLMQGVDARGAYANTGATSTAAWLRSATQAHRGRAGVEVKVAAALTRFPLLQEALASGRVSFDQVREFVAALQALPAGVSAERVSEAEAFVVAEWACFDPAQIRRLGRHLLHVMDPDGPALLEEEEQQAKRARELHVFECEGGVKLRGFLDTESAAALMTALDPLAAPRTGVDLPGGDPRSAPQRRADALVELATRALNAGDLPEQGSERPHLTVTMDLATLMSAASAYGGELDHGGPISAETARRICCDAKVIPVVLGGDSRPLDVGRERRTVPRHLRRAVVARDRMCAFPGCDRPPAWCEAHHVVFWSDGGRTALDNLVLLCGHHHDVIHHSPWRVRIDATTGQPVFTDPYGVEHGSNADLRRKIEQLARPPDP